MPFSLPPRMRHLRKTGLAPLWTVIPSFMLRAMSHSTKTPRPSFRTATPNDIPSWMVHAETVGSAPSCTWMPEPRLPEMSQFSRAPFPAMNATPIPRPSRILDRRTEKSLSLWITIPASAFPKSRTPLASRRHSRWPRCPAPSHCGNGTFGRTGNRLPGL